MVRTDQYAHGRFTCLLQTSPAVTTDISKSLHLLVIITHQYDGRLSDIDGGDIARFRYVARDTDQNPMFVEKDIYVGFKNILATKQAARHTMPKRAVG
jgi:hypothetical protein